MRKQIAAVLLLVAIVGGVVLLGGAGVGLSGEVAANTWQALGDGKFPLPEKGYPNMIGCRLVWLAEQDSALAAPVLSEHEVNVHLLSFADPRWVVKPGTAPEGLIPDKWESPRAYCYLPGLRQVLYLKEEWGYSRKRRPVASWLIDPGTGAWEPIAQELWMSDRSANFNPAAGRDGCRLPIWGAVCYDAHNKEAVSFGGGGTWGRVGKEREKVKPGDWIFDEAAKRVRRLLPDEKGIAEARKWYPGHCGTWVFPEADKKWKAIEQPMGQQPSGRILPGMAYDAAEKKIVLFGGDDLARCFNDTWVYDCTTRTWSEVKPKVTPRARAGHAMVYVPDQKVVLMAGGYAGGWQPLKDVWAFSLATKEWSRLGIDLPSMAGHASADYDAKRRQVVMAVYPGTRGNRTIPVYTLQLDMASVGKAEPELAAPKTVYHCKGRAWASDLPDEWLTGAGVPEKAEDVLARIKALPANTWKDMNPPKKARERTWGIYIYDPKGHTGFAWGGGHSGYPGAEITEYHLPINRWRGMDDAANYNPVWLHGMSGGPPGISFGGWSLLPSHARKSYGIDPISDSVVTYGGDVYSIKHHLFVDHIGNFPVNWNGPSYQVAYVTAPHGLHGFAATYGSKGAGWLCRANVAGGTWDVVSRDGPGGHNEYDFLVYESRRDRALYFKYKGADVWAFDFKAKTWAKEEAAGKKPSIVMGDGTYIPEMDAVMMMFADQPKEAEKLFFYKCDERKWYTAPSAGDPFRGVNTAKDYSPIYDAELGIVVRITQCGFAAWVNVHVMRLDPKALKLTPVD